MNAVLLGRICDEGEPVFFEIVIAGPTVQTGARHLPDCGAALGCAIAPPTVPQGQIGTFVQKIETALS